MFFLSTKKKKAREATEWIRINTNNSANLIPHLRYLYDPTQLNQLFLACHHGLTWWGKGLTSPLRSDLYSTQLEKSRRMPFPLEGRKEEVAQHRKRELRYYQESLTLANPTENLSITIQETCDPGKRRDTNSPWQTHKPELCVATPQLKSKVQLYAIVCAQQRRGTIAEKGKKNGTSNKSLRFSCASTGAGNFEEAKNAPFYYLVSTADQII